MKGGLLPLKKDNRDFSFKKQFGTTGIDNLPDEFEVENAIYVEDQRDTDMCAAFAVTSVSEDQEGVDLDPLYTFAKIKQIQGDWSVWGADLRDACKSQIKYGAIKKELSPHTISEDRDFIANWENWPEELDEKAIEHRKNSYFRVDEGFDTFSDIKLAIWQNRAKKRSILTGVRWQHHWLDSSNGIIKNNNGVSLFGHAFKVSGWKKINGEEYLIAVLSNGREIGDAGRFYFPREIVNQEFIYGAYMLEDINPDEIKKSQWSIWRRVWEAIKNYWSIVINEFYERTKRKKLC